MADDLVRIRFKDQSEYLHARGNARWNDPNRPRMTLSLHALGGYREGQEYEVSHYRAKVLLAYEDGRYFERVTAEAPEPPAAADAPQGAASEPTGASAEQAAGVGAAAAFPVPGSTPRPRGRPRAGTR